jgi:hypothetical protein
MPSACWVCLVKTLSEGHCVRACASEALGTRRERKRISMSEGTTWEGGLVPTFMRVYCLTQFAATYNGGQIGFKSLRHASLALQSWSFTPELPVPLDKSR